jgi:uncharacterized protein
MRTDKSNSIYYPVKVGKSTIDGKGTYALKAIPARRKIGELTGTIITEKQSVELAKKNKRIAMVELGNGKVLNAMSENSNDMRYINHSCDPNAYMRVVYNRVEFYALRNIRKNEELTCDYGETHHEGQLKCRCNSKNCKGRI